MGEEWRVMIENRRKDRLLVVKKLLIISFLDRDGFK